MTKIFTALAAVLCMVGFGAGAAHAQNLGDPQGPGSHLLFLTGENVQRELALTPSQKKSISRLEAEYRQEVEPFLKRADAQAATMLKASTRAFDQRARDLLTDLQLSRLYEVEAKALGPWILHAPAVQKQLGLTNRQIAQVNRIADKTEEYNQKLHAEVTDGNLTKEQRIQKMREFRLRESRKLEKVLTTDQRKALQKLAQS